MTKKILYTTIPLLVLCILLWLWFEFNIINPNYKRIDNKTDDICEFWYKYEYDYYSNSRACERRCEIWSNLVCNYDNNCYCDHVLYVWWDPETEPRYSDDEIENILKTYNPKDANDVEKAVKAYVDKFKKDLKKWEEIRTSGMICAYWSLVCKKDVWCGCNTEIQYNNQDVLNWYNIVVDNSKWDKKINRSYIFIHKREQIK